MAAIDLAVAFFVEKLHIICLIAVLLAVSGLWARHRTNCQLLDILTVGARGGYLPVGVLFILTAFYPEFTDKLRDFPVPTSVLGFVYIVYAVNKIALTYQK